MSALQYTFVYQTHCNMCGADLKDQKVLGKRLNQSQGYNPSKKIGFTTTICKCRTCGLIYANPMPKPASIEMHYGVPPESYWGEHYFNYPDNEIQVKTDFFQRILGDLKGKTALDIGAGIGKAMIALNRGGADAYGIEPSGPFYERAKEKMNIKADRIFHTSIEDADFADNMFDYICYAAVLEHVYDPSLTLKKITKWLKPGGVIYISVPNAKWLIARGLNRMYKLRGLDYVTNLSPFHVPYHLNEFTPESFYLNSKEGGYKIASIKNSICNTYMPKVLDPMVKWYMEKTGSGMELNVFLTK